MMLKPISFMKAQSGAALWTPADDSASFKLWIDPSDSAERTLSGSNITDLSDKLGVEPDFTITGTGPVLTSENGEDTINWSGGDGYFSGTTDVLVNESIWTLVKVDSGDTRFSLYGTTSGSLTAVPLGINGDGSSDWARTDGAGADPIPLINTVTPSPAITTRDIGYDSHVTGTWLLIEWKMGAAGGGAGLTNLVFPNVNADYDWNGEQAEIIISDGAASSTIREKVEGYLAWKYGQQALLPGPHPYSSAAPTA